MMKPQRTRSAEFRHNKLCNTTFRPPCISDNLERMGSSKWYLKTFWMRVMTILLLLLAFMHQLQPQRSCFDYAHHWIDRKIKFSEKLHSTLETNYNFWSLIQVDSVTIAYFRCCFWLGCNFYWSNHQSPNLLWRLKTNWESALAVLRSRWQRSNGISIWELSEGTIPLPLESKRTMQQIQTRTTFLPNKINQVKPQNFCYPMEALLNS